MFKSSLTYVKISFSSVPEAHHFYVAPALGKSFDAVAVPAPAPLYYIIYKANLFKTKQN
jgi:hypothetical protein